MRYTTAAVHVLKAAAIILAAAWLAHGAIWEKAAPANCGGSLTKFFVAECHEYYRQ